MKVIAFSGRARCGKSYISTVLAKALWDSGDYIPVILPLAAPLKAAAAEAGFTKTGDPQGYRNYCQTVGAEARDADEDHWLKQWHDMYLDAMMRELGYKQEMVVIVDDVRYPNELKLINGMANANTVFVNEGSRSGTLEDDDAEWRQHHSEYLANDARDNWSKYKDQFDFLFVNDGDAFADLETYLTMGEGCGKVIEAWLGNHDCPCALCECYISNTELDEDALIGQLDDAMKQNKVDMEDDVDDEAFFKQLLDAVDEAIEEAEDTDDEVTDEDFEAINRTLSALFGIDADEVEDILENLDEEDDDDESDPDSTE